MAMCRPAAEKAAHAPPANGLPHSQQQTSTAPSTQGAARSNSLNKGNSRQASVAKAVPVVQVSCNKHLLSCLTDDLLSMDYSLQYCRISPQLYI